MVKVFYDGICYVCDGEVNHYKKHKAPIEWINIAAPNFQAEPYGFTNKDVQKSLHAIDHQGNVHKGVDSFVVIWNQLPNPYPYFSKIIKVPGIYALAKIVYACFAKIRMYLPKKQTCSIEASPKKNKE